MNKQNYFIMSDDTVETKNIPSLSKYDEKRIDDIINQAIKEAKK